MHYYGLKSWKPFTGSTLNRRRPQASDQDVQAIEMLCKQLGVKVSPHALPAPCHIEELSESPAVCQALEIAQNTEGKILLLMSINDAMWLRMLFICLGCNAL